MKENPRFTVLIGHLLRSGRRSLARARQFGPRAYYITARAGAPEPGRPHYYRVQGPSFVVEYSNVQNNANHIHVVWRDYANDFGGRQG